MKTPVIASLVLVACAPVTVLGAAAPAADRLLVCAGQEDPVARLACFDREVAPLVESRRAAPVLPQPAATAAPAPAPLPSFGEEHLKDRPEATPEESILHARIATTRGAGGGIYLVTLDNGQVWRHEEGSRAEYFIAGEDVTITRAAMGSYRLTLRSGKSKNWLRVTRVR